MAEHYYSKEPVSASHERRIAYEIKTGEGTERFTFVTDNGVFSGDRVDHGTDILLRVILKDRLKREQGAAARIWDIGCGYGPIGITLGRLHPEAFVQMTDVNERAMDLARRNAVQAGLKHFEVTAADSAVVDEAFDLIVTNPPIRAGKAVIYQIFAQAQDSLATGGSFYVVIRKNQGAPSAAKELERLFGACETVGREAGYHVLRVTK